MYYTESVERNKVYIETSVWGMVVNEEPVVYHEAAVRFFEEYGIYSIYISVLVLEEIERAKRQVFDEISRFVDKVNPSILPVSSNVDELAKEYIRRGVFTEKTRADAIHVAYATVNDMDYLLSFNFRHIVRVRAKELIQATNLFMGYRTPVITWPEEMIGDEDDI